MMNTLFDLQLFAGDSAAEIPEAGNEREAGAEQEAPEEKKAEPKYTDADIDRIIGQKFAEWQKKQDKKVSEAERLGKMTAEEKTAERIKTLYGRAFRSIIDEKEFVLVPKENDNLINLKQVSKSEIIKAIEPRVNEMLEIINNYIKIRQSFFSDFNNF